MLFRCPGVELRNDLHGWETVVGVSGGGVAGRTEHARTRFPSVVAVRVGIHPKRLGTEAWVVREQSRGVWTGLQIKVRTMRFRL